MHVNYRNIPQVQARCNAGKDSGCYDGTVGATMSRSVSESQLVEGADALVYGTSNGLAEIVYVLDH